MAPGLSAARRASRVFRRFKRVPLAVVATIAALIGGYLVWPVVASSATPLPVFDVNHAGVFQMGTVVHQFRRAGFVTTVGSAGRCDVP